MIRDPGHGQEGSASLSFFVRLDCRIFFFFNLLVWKSLRENVKAHGREQSGKILCSNFLDLDSLCDAVTRPALFGGGRK